ncbi:MAG: hypothetical protein MT490_08775 [Sphingomonas sp.]|uniref:hypothetical protein n=1 Tax=Sphingomonas sp. TaxID=28214 RepID=UPI002274A5AD|nr:hypothetical protein [Sphingomonas sp.]MCX8475874.1 hypothetical protein [Sphingomonas sp.]
MTALGLPNGGPEPQATTSRRSVLRVLTAPLAIPAGAVVAPGSGRIAPLFDAYGDEPVALRRSRAGRRLSRFRYHNAEGFFLGIEKGIVPHPTDRLYQIGIVLQLGLSAHLLDVGFADSWCARHIGLNVARSLAHANATGLGFETTDMELLAAILSPYSKWRNASSRDVAPDFPFSTGELRMLTRALLDRVHQVTGHTRPRGWQHRLP